MTFFLNEKSWRAEAPLQLVHTSLGGNRYFIILIDDFSKKLWYSLKEKSAAFTTFKHFKALIEAKSNTSQ